MMPLPSRVRLSVTVQPSSPSSSTAICTGEAAEADAGS